MDVTKILTTNLVPFPTGASQVSSCVLLCKVTRSSRSYRTKTCSSIYGLEESLYNKADSHHHMQRNYLVDQFQVPRSQRKVPR